MFEPSSARQHKSPHPTSKQPQGKVAEKTKDFFYVLKFGYIRRESHLMATGMLLLPPDPLELKSPKAVFYCVEHYQPFSVRYISFTRQDAYSNKIGNIYETEPLHWPDGRVVTIPASLQARFEEFLGVVKPLYDEFSLDNLRRHMYLWPEWNMLKDQFHLADFGTWAKMVLHELTDRDAKHTKDCYERDFFYAKEDLSELVQGKLRDREYVFKTWQEENMRPYDHVGNPYQDWGYDTPGGE